jgi:predicted ATPase/DNA-binding SARP family transcriptional activator
MEIRVLGPIEVAGDDGPVRLAASMQRRLLAALVVSAGEARSPDTLIDALWGASPPASAPKLLQVYVSQLRKVLPAPARIRTRGPGYAIELDHVSLDAGRFERLLKEGREALAGGNPALAGSLLTRALDLWRGAAYADVAYEDFARAEAERLEELRQVAIEERIEAGLALGRHGELLAELMSLATAHPLRERMQAQAMLALYRCGRQSQALELYAAVRARLHDELGLEPTVELRELQRRILQHDPSLVVPLGADEPLALLPTPSNALLGRERELNELRTLLLRHEVQLLVLTGAGGSGKTRLALEVARETVSSFANGAALVSLAPVRDAELIVGEISRALGVREAVGEEALETLAAALRPRELLLVLDNAEHLRAATAVFVDLIRSAPRLTLLVTSRAVLHLSGEHVYPVEPLDDHTAAALFIERARDANPHFSPDQDDDEAIRRICRRLDGLPLAIELAASRIRALTPAELLARLDPRLPLLVGGPRDLPARQQTLRATLQWSFDLLDEGEAHDLMRLAVFDGGCTLEAAEAVCGTTVDRLSSLIDNNLLRRTATAIGSRSSMLETIREYALERLEAEGALEAARAAHADFYRALAEQGADELEHGERAVLERFEAELDNFRSAFARLQEANPESALRLAAALGNFWFPRGELMEGRRWLTAVLERRHRPSRDLAVLTAELARLHFFLGESHAAGCRTEQAVEMAESLGLPDVLCAALNTQSSLLQTAGRYDEALALLERALAIARDRDLGRPLLRTLFNLSHQMTTRDRQLEATQNDLSGLELSRRRGDRMFEQFFLVNLLWGYVLLGEWDAALGVVEESEKSPLPNVYGLFGPLPWLYVQRGQVDEARRTLEAHGHLATWGDLQGRIVYTLGRAVVLRAEEHPREALAAAEEVLSARDTLGGRHGFVKFGFLEAVEAAFALDDLDRVAALLGEWEQRPLDRTPFIEAQRERFAARLAARRGDSDTVQPALVRATERFRELSRPFYVAVALLEHGEWLAGQGHGDDAEPLLAEACEIFQRLKAMPWFERASRSREARRAEAVT